MKTIVPRLLLLVCLTSQTIKAPAALSYSWTGPQTISDNDASGLAFGFSLSDPTTSIANITLSLNISGGYNGDLYAYLSHGDGFAVLLNRVGRTGTSDFGYSTTGFLMTFTSDALPDIHNYQTLGPIYNGSGQLTGTWGADGRDVDPGLAFDTTDRTSTLAGFNGLDPNGDWTIYFRDDSAGAISILNSWSVDVTTVVPEPTCAALLGAFAIVGLLFQRRSRGDAKELR